MAANAFHLSLNVANLEMSVGFYRLLFGQDPAKWYPDYAKFEVDSPALVLSLEPSKPTPGGTLNHLGLRVKDVAEVEAYEQRLGAMGVPMQRLNDIECCYSRQSKIVFRDPDANLIEVYVVEGESDWRETPVASAAPEAATAGPTIAPTWQHLLGSEFPDAIPVNAASLSEVRLRGTFNREAEFTRGGEIVREAKRALEDGGQLLVHLLVANRPLSQALPPLPPPADQVRFVPTEVEVVSVIEAAGFAHVEIKRLSHSPVMQLGDVELRELLVHARKPRETSPADSRDVVYKGPFAKIEDDRGRVFARGRRVAVGGSELAWLESQGWLEDFVVLDGGDGTACGAI